MSVKPMSNGIFEVTASLKLGGIVQEKKMQMLFGF